ncbi:MAG TPA: FimV/HubP family polar landmark protein [Steroidobacteraceae bacterium]
MKTAVRRVLLMSALMSPGALYALGLGDIKLNSALNQPFDAEIELVSATQDDLGALRASLASGDIFARYGLDRPAYLADFSFRVTKGAGGKDVLRVTSPRPVTEPFVTMLVEASWPRGRLLREYTVLLDPPVYAPSPTAPEAVATPRVSSGGATSARAAEPAATESTPARTTRAAMEPAAAPTLEPGSTYQVRRNDTLWEIASAVSPGSRADVNRAMVSIYQNNPHAFDGNINILRSGSTLRIPDAKQIQSVSAAEASAEVARQYDSWRNASATATAATSPEARLRLVTPEQGSAAPSTTVAPAPAGTTQAAAPAGSGKTPAAAAADVDLQNRVKQLEAELTEAKRLLEVRNAELATLQGGAALAEGTTPPAEGATPAAEGAAPATAEPAAAPAAQPPAAAAKPAEQKPVEPAGPSLLERAMEYWWALLALVAAALAFVLFKRLRSERGDAEEHLEEALGARDLRATPTYTPRSRESDIVVEEKRATAAAVAPVAAAATKARAAEPARKAAVEETLGGEAAAGADSGDPLAEADFHMAYGLYDQAADLVQLAIKREPQRRDLKLKLLEIFFVWGNRDRFMELARELNASRAAAPAGEWDKVLIMGKQIAPDDPIFAGATSGADSLDMELHGAATGLDFDLAGGPSVPDVDLGEEPSRADSSGLDFVLDEPGDESVQPTVETPRLKGDDAPTVETPRAADAVSDTQELTVDDLGLDLDSLRALDALDAEAGKGGERVDDTVEAAAVPSGGQSLLGDDTDMLSATSLMKMVDSTAVMPVGDEAEPGVVDLTEVTGELPLLEADLSATVKTVAKDYDLGSEPATMSEVGTKLDLARAYMDMGDPEGARSILDEVLHEGNAAQKQEAERLIASLP